MFLETCVLLCYLGFDSVFIVCVGSIGLGVVGTLEESGERSGTWHSLELSPEEEGMGVSCV